jgi:hypothetical protein
MEKDKLSTSSLVALCLSVTLAALAVVGCSPDAPASQTAHPKGSTPPLDSASVSDQGLDLYKKGDFLKAIEWWRPLAD